jgi:hypothetical protein
MNRWRAILAVGFLCYLSSWFIGWALYRRSPEGMLFYTPNRLCPPLAHSLSSGLLFGLIAWAALALAFGICCGVGI